MVVRATAYKKLQIKRLKLRKEREELATKRKKLGFEFNKARDWAQKASILNYL